MSRKMTMLWFAVGVVLLIALGLVVSLTVSHRRAQAACVTVNGVVLTNREVDLAYEQQKEGVMSYTREQVIEATVRNMVVRDYGREQGITVTEAEMDHLIDHYKETGYYEEAVEMYGEEGLRQGLCNHELFVRTKDVILTHQVTVQEVTEEDIAAFLQENGLAHMTLTDKQREDVVSTLTEHKTQEAYDAFVDRLMAGADILYG